MMLQMTKGDIYLATVQSPVVGSVAGGCPVYDPVGMTCVRMRNLPPNVVQNDIYQFFRGLQVSLLDWWMLSFPREGLMLLTLWHNR